MIIWLSFVSAVVLAVAVPEIGPFIGLIGAFCFSLLGIVAPVLIEFATYWDNVTVFMVVRNVVLIVIGFLALVFGTTNSIEEILNTQFSKDKSLLNSTLPAAQWRRPFPTSSIRADSHCAEYSIRKRMCVCLYMYL